MTVAERLPTLDNAELATLHANALRLQAADGKQARQASDLIPLIEAELAQRLAAKPPKAAAVRKKKVAAAPVVAEQDA